MITRQEAIPNSTISTPWRNTLNQRVGIQYNPAHNFLKSISLNSSNFS